jgi:hypothetical protein
MLGSVDPDSNFNNEVKKFATGFNKNGEQKIYTVIIRRFTEGNIRAKCSE